MLVRFSLGFWFGILHLRLCYTHMLHIPTLKLGVCQMRYRLRARSGVLRRSEAPRRLSSVHIFFGGLHLSSLDLVENAYKQSVHNPTPQPLPGRPKFMLLNAFLLNCEVVFFTVSSFLDGTLILTLGSKYGITEGDIFQFISQKIQQESSSTCSSTF